MILFVDSENKVRAVNHTEDDTLTPLYVDENNPLFPFEGWSTSLICCYEVTVQDGIVTMMTPYVDSKMLDTIDMMGHQIDSVTPITRTKTAYIDDTEVVFFDVPEGALVVSFANGNREYTVTRIGNNLKVEFAPLEEVTTITIKIN